MRACPGLVLRAPEVVLRDIVHATWSRSTLHAVTRRLHKDVVTGLDSGEQSARRTVRVWVSHGPRGFLYNEKSTHKTHLFFWCSISGRKVRPFSRRYGIPCIVGLNLLTPREQSFTLQLYFCATRSTFGTSNTVSVALGAFHTKVSRHG